VRDAVAAPSVARPGGADAVAVQKLGQWED